MKKIHLFITISVCKLLIWGLHLFGFSANNLPGNFCLKFHKNILKDLTMPKYRIIITGTNGKTVSSITLSHILRKNGYSVMNNEGGSNLNSGIISEFLKNADVTGKIRTDAYVLEVDEDACAKMCSILDAQYLIITNLYRDSISRNAHADYVYEKLEKIPENVKLILNADDSISGTLGTQSNPKIFYGAQKAPGKSDKSENIICDIRVCPKCLMPITYDYIQFHHIGRSHCEHCGFCMPEPSIYASEIDMTENTFVMTDRRSGEGALFHFPTGNLFEIYNHLAVSSLCIDLGMSVQKISDALQGLENAGGRFQNDRANDTQIISMVGKSQNPISCSQSFAKARTIPGKKVIILAINDREYGTKSHHEDTSWFYDTDFEFLISDDVLQYICVGPRAYDTALRLILAGAQSDRIQTYFNYTTDVAKLVDYDAVKGGSILYYFEVYFREWSKRMKNALLEEARKHEEL